MPHFKTHRDLTWSGNAKDRLANAPKASVDVQTKGDGVGLRQVEPAPSRVEIKKAPTVPAVMIRW